MERFLIALDCMPGCTKVIDYILRVLSGAQDMRIRDLSCSCN